MEFKTHLSENVDRKGGRKCVFKIYCIYFFKSICMYFKVQILVLITALRMVLCMFFHG